MKTPEPAMVSIRDNDFLLVATVTSACSSGGWMWTFLFFFRKGNSKKDQKNQILSASLKGLVHSKIKMFLQIPYDLLSFVEQKRKNTEECTGHSFTSITRLLRISSSKSWCATKTSESICQHCVRNRLKSNKLWWKRSSDIYFLQYCDVHQSGADYRNKN